MTSRNKHHQPHLFRALLRSTASSISVAELLLLFGNQWLFAALVVSTLSTLGCGGSKGVAPVHGVVKLDGQPFTEGFVTVTPAEGRMSKGTIQPDGSFVLGTYSDSDGVKIGTHPVTMLPPTAVEGAPLSAAALSLPRRYSVAVTSGITVDVKPNTDNELLIEMTTN